LLTPFSIALVLSAAFLHASWNALLRGGADRTQSMLIMCVTLGLTGFAMIAIAGLPKAALGYVLASGLIHLCYNALLVRMYHSGDLGETYPVARGSSPALIALGGSVFAGEWMAPLAILGVGLVCIGIFMLAAARARPATIEPKADHKGGRLHGMNLPYALLTGVSIAGYSVVDGLGVRASANWVAYTGGIFASFLVMPFWYFVRQGKAAFRTTRWEVLKAASGGLISLAAYGAIIWAVQGNAMGAVSALRETSVVFAAFLGAAFLKERLTGLRLAACCVIALGAVCVGWWL
jgi:drug/metabolite transporter (DMT)-like permease